jgi:integrase
MGRPRKLPDGIRIRNDGYHADFYAGGRRVRKRLSGNLRVATQLLAELRARAERADFGLLDNDFPIDDLKEQYLKHCRQMLKPASERRYRICLDGILPRLGASRVAQIVVENVLTYRQERLAEDASPRTVNMEVGALATMLRWGKKHRLLGSNPIEELAPLPHDNPKEGRALDSEEVKRLLARSRQPWRDIWYAFLVTGMRKEELASLTFADIDWEAREILVRSGVAKNHTGRRIPIDNGLWDILKRQEADRGRRVPGKGRTAKITERIRARFTREHVFVSSQNTPLSHRSGLYHAFLRSCKQADIQVKTLDADGRPADHVDLHSLRRTFATSLIVGGADPKSVQELLGHKTLDMTMRIYAKVHAQTKRQALGKLPYGQGTLAPAHVLEYPGKGEGFPVQFGHQSVTGASAEPGPAAQIVGG